MVAMPYVLVNIVLDIVSLTVFCVTSAMLLSRSRLAGLALPAPVRQRRAVAFVAHALLLSLLAMLIFKRFRSVDILSLPISEWLFYVGFINSVILAYQFMNKRYFLRMPRLRRRLLIAIFSIVMTSVPAIALIAAVFGLFIIR